MTKKLTENQKVILSLLKAGGDAVPEMDINENEGWINPLIHFPARNKTDKALRNAFDQLVKKGFAEKRGSINLYRYIGN